MKSYPIDAEGVPLSVTTDAVYGHTNYLTLITCFSVLGGGLFGLDIGVVGSMLNMEDFKRRFESDVWVFGLISSGMNIGAFLFCGIAGPLADAYGRRDTIGFTALAFTVLALWQGLSDSFAMLFVGRVLSGGSIAVCATIVPVYISELAPSEKRGALVSLQQSAIGFSIMFIYWVAWSIKGISTSGMLSDWRLCFYVSGLPSLLLGSGIWFCPRSPRWLLRNGRREEAKEALALLRIGREVSNSQEEAQVEEELSTIAEVLEKEAMLGESSCSALCATPAMRNVTVAAFLVQLFQQVQGVNCIMYFGPMVVDGFGLDGNLFTGVVQTCNFVFTFCAVCFVDSVGRKPLLKIGTGIMLTTMTIIGSIGLTDGKEKETGQHVLQHQGFGFVCILCFVIYLAAFAATWGPVGWLIPSEVFPLRHRIEALLLLLMRTGRRMLY